LDIGWLIPGIVFSIFGILMLFFLFLRFDLFFRSKKWPSVEGTIETSRLHVEDKEDDSGHHFFLCSGEISYRYQIEENEYIAREPVHVESTDRQSANELVAAYSVGKRVDVFYNPQEPQESTLDTKSREHWSVYLAIGLVFLGVGGLCLFWAFKT